jgi:nicotinate-nucleotide pyrophosphorylase (carboxylating)
MGLYDAVLIKENHVAVAGSIGEAIAKAREAGRDDVEVETRSLSEVSEAVAAGADRILLDNMDPTALARAVALARGAADSPLQIEASGGVNLQNVRRVAETGVDEISVGALTHSAPALDMSMMLRAV